MLRFVEIGGPRKMEDVLSAPQLQTRSDTATSYLLRFAPLPATPRAKDARNVFTNAECEVQRTEVPEYLGQQRERLWLAALVVRLQLYAAPESGGRHHSIHSPALSVP